MATILDKAAEKEYLALVRAFPLVSIRDDAHLAEALAIIDGLLEQPHTETAWDKFGNAQSAWPMRSPAEDEYVRALSDLVEVYETAHVAIPPVSGVEALRYLMSENGLSQADLAPLFGSPSIISEVLSGKRRLTLAHIARLAERFGLPADVFIDRRWAIFTIKTKSW